MNFGSNHKDNNKPATPFDPNDEDLGPSVSMAVMADDDDDFKKSTFGMKRTTSVGKFGIKKNALSSLSSSNLAHNDYQQLTPPSVNNDAIPSPTDSKHNSPPVNYVPRREVSMSPEPSNYNGNKNSSKMSFNQNDPVHILPKDDAYVSQEPSAHVDYLSHKWDESELSKSWKYIILQKKKKNNENNNDGLIHHDDMYSRSGSMMSPSATPQDTRFGDDMHDNSDKKDTEVDMDSINASRLENASWRTWAKARNNLKTVSPEILNWSKDNDITWLYGPIVPAESKPIVFTEPEYKKNDKSTLKPILKKTTVTEVIERNAQWKLDQIRNNYIKKHGGKLPTNRLEDSSNYRTHSPAVYGSNEASKAKEIKEPRYQPEDFQALAAKVNAQYSQTSISSKKSNLFDNDPNKALNDKKLVMASLLSTERTTQPHETLKNLNGSSANNTPLQNELNSASSKPQKKHIRFNDRVEQCISLMPDLYNAINQKHTRGSSDEEDFKRMRKRSKIVLPSGITLGTGNGGSSDESSSSDSDWDMDSEDENNTQPEFIEDSRKPPKKNSKADYSTAYTRYYRGPALPVSDSSGDGSSSDDDSDDIFSLKTPIATTEFSSRKPSITERFSSSHGSNKPDFLLNDSMVTTLKNKKDKKKTYPPSIKRIPATKLNCAEDLFKTTMPFGDDSGRGHTSSHGYNNYDYNTVFKHENTILDNNSGINFVDVPLRYAPTAVKKDENFNLDDAISKKTSHHYMPSLSRTSSATSGLARGFADSLTLNSAAPSLTNVNRLGSKKGSMFDLGDDSDEEDNNVDDFFKKENSKVDFSFLNKSSSAANIKTPFGSGVLLGGNPTVSSHNSFLSGSGLSLSGSQSDFRENTLSRSKTRNESSRSVSSMNMMNQNNSHSSVQVGKFKHNLSQPPKRSFSLFAEDESDSD